MNFPWRIFVTVIPLIMAMIALQFFVPDNDLRAAMPSDWWKSHLKPEGYSGGFIGYATASSVHILMCITVIAFNLYHIWACTAATRRNLITIAVLYTLLLSVLLLVTKNPDLAVYKITFLNIKELYEGTRLFGVLQDSLGFHVMLPTLFGIAATIFAATGAESLFADFDKEASKLNQLELKAKIAILKRGFQSLSVVLVSTIIAAAIAFHLPARLYQGEGEKLINAYADELTIFWGAIFTLTLIATYAPHLFRLRSLSKAYAKQLRKSQPDSSLPDWLSDTALFGNLQTHLGAIFTLLAPLITGSIGSVIQSLSAVS
ncbi:hypothetical protein [Pelagibius sp. Alg239-R121]|uniref:hypothetical protein n=1 Tax=Pelagibius sp. Alg239-R121 TaxID=2993448 RepID=UPI0024A674F3|nr:hypothetical protein [Pelagibius sp. Alg239-R121]